MQETDNTLLTRFGKHLETIRKQKKFSFRELAARCNVDSSDINKIEKGRKNITLTTLVDLATGLGVHPKKLLDFDMS
jgi:transcriptional regulator with XRE-family HTH domain